MDMGPIPANASLDLVHLGKMFTIDFTKKFVSFTALTKFMDNQKIHVVEGEFFEIFLLHTFRLIGAQTKQDNMQLAKAKKSLTSWNKNV